MVLRFDIILQMLPADFRIRTEFPHGEQARVTPAISEISALFTNSDLPSGFKEIHDYLFTKLHIVPYDETVVEAEKTRRWKLTANELLQVGTIIDTKYCNDVVNLYLAVAKGMGLDAKLAKVFNEKLKVHSLALIGSPNSDSKYLINAGSKDKFWVEELPSSLDLAFGTVLPHEWFIWKVDQDQWSMGLVDSSQEDSTIITDAQKFFETSKK